MADAAEAAIEVALLGRLSNFQRSTSPADLTVAYPNVEFTPPQASPTTKWLRASFVPLPSTSPHISQAGGVNKHYGFMQVDVFYGQGGGDIAPARIAAQLIEYFKRGTQIWHDGFSIRILSTPTRHPSIKDDPWWMIPVRIPYTCFASDPA